MVGLAGPLSRLNMIYRIVSTTYAYNLDPIGGDICDENN